MGLMWPWAGNGMHTACGFCGDDGIVLFVDISLCGGIEERMWR